MVPWLGQVPPSAGRRASLGLMAVGWMMVGLALWARLGLPEWLAASRPPVVLEAFFGETVVPYQVETLVKSVQEQPFACEVRFVSADEAQAEAAKDERARSLLEAYGGNPFLRSLRVTLCPASVESYHTAAAWLGMQPGVASVRVPETFLSQLIAGGQQLRGTVEAASTAAGLAGLLVVLGALGLCGTLQETEAARWTRMGAGLGTLWMRALRAVAVPGLVSSLAAAAILEAAGAGVRYAGILPLKNLPQLPLWPHAADWMLAVGGAVAGLIASVWSLLPSVRRPNK